MYQTKYISVIKKYMSYIVCLLVTHGNIGFHNKRIHTACNTIPTAKKLTSRRSDQCRGEVVVLVEPHAAIEK